MTCNTYYKKHTLRAGGVTCPSLRRIARPAETSQLFALEFQANGPISLGKFLLMLHCVIDESLMCGFAA